ncbi:hypothetical protein [Spiroplasma endosymbiont of Colias croceus]|uniref:hypothetical protein n=1 Tax=Spiroplasma endosymbiont of Colias croceus TaxID=3066310 RepID=UPI0030D04D10
MSNKIINCQALLIICYEGKTKNLNEETYFKQLNEHIKIKKPSYIPFNEIKFIKREANQITDIKKTINFLIARGIKSKFSYICIWKDNDNQKNVQHENKVMFSNLCNLQKQLCLINSSKYN